MDKRDFTSSIREAVSTLGSVTGQGAVFHPTGSGSLIANDDVCAFCAYCLKHGSVGPYCRYACHTAAMQTLSSGEPHYQRCWAGLLYVSVAVAPGGEFSGGIAIGGFYAEGEEAAIEAGLIERLAAIPRADPKPFLSRLGSLREIAPSALRGLGLFLMETTFSSGINSSKWFRKRHDDYVQQREIAEAYADLQQEEVTPPDVMADTYQLMSYLHRRDREGAMQFISRYLAKLLLISNWNLTKLRAHVRVLLAVITSQDVLSGMDWASATRREWLYMNRIEKAADTETICSEVAELVLQHFGRADTLEAGEQTLGDRLAEWLERNCQEKATLEDAARAIGASVSTIAHQLPQETGKTFGQLRRETRIALAKRLLATSTMGISTIADACGFSDQSHFTRVFKAEISLTPGEFRKMLKRFEKKTSVL
jgi:AraC-like DNA-binding protein